MKSYSVVAFALLASASLAGCNANRSVSPLPIAGGDVVREVVPRTAPADYGPQTFAYAGKPQTYVVPAGVTSVTVQLEGAGSAGLPGGYTEATLHVTAGEQLQILVGGKGKKFLGGYPNGGAGGSTYNPAYGGGGASEVLHQNGTPAAVAGGAGGASAHWAGGGAGGGTAGNSGTSYKGPSSPGGTQTCKGAGGAGGIGGQGGKSNGNKLSFYGGGGGGGGYCGGAGGVGSHVYYKYDVGDSGGGGGSGYYESSATGAKTTVAGGSPYDGRVVVAPPAKIFTLLNTTNRLEGVAFDTKGNAYVADTGSENVWQFSPTGTKTQVGGSWYTPRGVAVDGAGNVYVADPKKKALVEVSPPFDNKSHGTITTIKSDFEADWVAVTADGTIFVTATGHSWWYPNWWELREIVPSKKIDNRIHWDGSTINFGYQVAVMPNCSPGDYTTCLVWVQVDDNFVNPPKHEVWQFWSNADYHTVITAETLHAQPFGLSASRNQLYVIDGVNDVLKDYDISTGGEFGIGAGNLIGPYAIAVQPGCATECKLLINNGNNTQLEELVP